MRTDISLLAEHETIMLTDETNFFDEPCFCVSGYTNSDFQEYFNYDRFNPADRSRAFAEAARLYNSYVPAECRISEQLHQDAMIEFRERTYIDTYRCFDTFGKVFLHNIFASGSLLYG